MFHSRCNGVVIICLGLLGAAATGLLPAPTAAGTATTTLAVSVDVQNECLISAQPLNFGVYVKSKDTLATTTLTVTCTGAYQVGLDQGLAGTGEFSRNMTGPGGTLSYSLYSNANYLGSGWGNTPGVSTFAGFGDTQIPVYGKILAGQNVAPGTYTDTVVATVTY